MSNSSLVLISRSDEANHFLARKLQVLKNEIADFQLQAVHPNSLSTVLGPQSTAAIVNLTDWSRTDAQLLVNMRVAGFEGPVLVLAQGVPGASFRNQSLAKNVSFLEKPFQYPDLIGIARRMLEGDSVHARNYKRFAADFQSIVEFEKDRLRYRSRSVNVSKGGACLELSSVAAPIIGDRLEVRLILDERSRIYHMRSKIAWARPSAERGNQFVGIQFLGVKGVESRAIHLV